MKEKQIQNILNKYLKGAKVTELARQYNIHHSTVIYHLKRYKVYKNFGKRHIDIIKKPKKYIKKIETKKYKSYQELLQEARKREKKKYNYISW